MKILEDPQHWRSEYEKGWLAHYLETGEMDWKRYNRPRNAAAPAGAGVELARSRLALISSAGGFLRDRQEPFVAAKAFLGDYSIRQFPSSTPLEDLAFTHEAYDHRAVEQDPQVLVPLRHLDALVAEGVVGELAPSVISFCGWQPDVIRTIDELIPRIVEAALDEQVDAALLVPA